jgi:hypothetical protein
MDTYKFFSHYILSSLFVWKDGRFCQACRKKRRTYMAKIKLTDIKLKILKGEIKT